MVARQDNCPDRLKTGSRLQRPILIEHNDYMQIYLKGNNDGFTLTDGGYTLDDLEQSGCKIDSPKRQALLKMTLNGFGVEVKDRALNVSATQGNFGPRKHDLVQAMLAVNRSVLPSIPVCIDPVL